MEVAPAAEAPAIPMTPALALLIKECNTDEADVLCRAVAAYLRPDPADTSFKLDVHHLALMGGTPEVPGKKILNDCTPAEIQAGLVTFLGQLAAAYAPLFNVVNTGEGEVIHVRALRRLWTIANAPPVPPSAAPATTALTESMFSPLAEALTKLSNTTSSEDLPNDTLAAKMLQYNEKYHEGVSKAVIAKPSVLLALKQHTDRTSGGFPDFSANKKLALSNMHPMEERMGSINAPESDPTVSFRDGQMFVNISAKPRILKTSKDLAESFETLGVSFLLMSQGFVVAEGVLCGKGFQIDGKEELVRRGPMNSMIQLYHDAACVLPAHAMLAFLTDTLKSLVQMTTSDLPRMTPTCALGEILPSTRTRLLTVMAMTSPEVQRPTPAAATTSKAGASPALERQIKEKDHQILELKKRASPTKPSSPAKAPKPAKGGYAEGSLGPGDFKRVTNGNKNNPVGCRDPRCKGPCAFNHEGK